jgi:hypothetical protein
MNRRYAIRKSQVGIRADDENAGARISGHRPYRLQIIRVTCRQLSQLKSRQACFSVADYDTRVGQRSLQDKVN